MKDRVWNRIYDILISSNSYYLAKKLEAAQEREDERLPKGLWKEFDDTFVYGAELIEIGEKALEENYGTMKEESNAGE